VCIFVVSFRPGQGPFAQRITTTSSPPLLASSTGGPFPWANLSSAVFNNNEIDRPTVIMATSKPQVAILGSQVEEEKMKEIFSAPHYLPEPPIKTELIPPAQEEGEQEQHQQQKVSEQEQEQIGVNQNNQPEPVVPSSEILPPPREVTTTQSPLSSSSSSSSDDNIVDEQLSTTQSVVVNDETASNNDQVAESTNAPPTQASFSVADNEVVVGVTEQQSHDEIPPTYSPFENDQENKVIQTTEAESSNSISNDETATTETPPSSEVEGVTTSSVNVVVQDEPAVVTTERSPVLDISADEQSPDAVTTESFASFVSLDEVVQTTEKSSESVIHDEISHSDDNDHDVVTTKIPTSNFVNDEVATTETSPVRDSPSDEVATTETSPVRDSPSDEVQTTEAAPQKDESNDVNKVTEIPSELNLEDAAETTTAPEVTNEISPSASHDESVQTTGTPISETEYNEASSHVENVHDDDDSEVIQTTIAPAEDSPVVQSNDQSEVVNAAENVVNVSSEDIIPPEEGAADLPEIHNQVLSVDEDTVELSAPVTVKVESPSTSSSSDPVAADEPVATTPADQGDDDEEHMHPDDQHADGFNFAEEMTVSPNTESPVNRFRLDLSSNEISIEDENKKSEDVVTPETTTARIFRDEKTTGDDLTTVAPSPFEHDETGTTENSFIQHDDISTNPPASSTDSRFRTALGESDEIVETSTVSAIRNDDLESPATTEAPSKFRSDLLELVEQDETEVTTSLPLDESSSDASNDEAIQVSTSRSLNDETPTTSAPSRLRSDLFDSVESVEQTTLAPTRLRFGLLESSQIDDEPVEQSITLRQETIKLNNNNNNNEETVSFDDILVGGETTISPSRLRSGGLISSEETGDDLAITTTLSPNRLRNEEEKTTEASLNDEAGIGSEATTEGSSSRLRSELLDEETSSSETIGVSTIPPPSRLRSALSQELFSSEDDPVQTTFAPVADSAADESSSSDLPDSPTTARSSLLGNRLRTSGNQDSEITTSASSVVYQDFVEVTSSAPIQEEIISYTSQQSLRSDNNAIQEGGTSEPISFQDEVVGSTLQPSGEFKSEAIEATTTASYALNDEEETTETTSTPLPIIALHQAVDVPSMIPPVDPEMPIQNDERIGSDDGLSSSDSWFEATYNKLRALAGLFPKNDASSKSKKSQRSPRRHHL